MFMFKQRVGLVKGLHFLNKLTRFGGKDLALEMSPFCRFLPVRQ